MTGRRAQRRARPAGGAMAGYRKSAKGEAGFTLVELLVVLSLMAILLTVFVPKLMDYRDSMAERERAANEDAINKAIRQCYALEGMYPPATGETGLDYLRERYGVALRPERYDYSYSVVNGKPRLAVELAGADADVVGQDGVGQNGVDPDVVGQNGVGSDGAAGD